jgi:predicted HicB family RNase H-like nuclease
MKESKKVFKHIESDLHKAIKAEAAKLGVTISEYIRKLYDDRIQS